ncbi:dehydrogenase [Coprinopsis marcescibilis]|uniref:Dehydrogenase n=1 Tax=Coprinopsis marcescibilis TaxID=230819 RepID=A0A5C3KJ24_COPMA|nr:dehydrogenase [Coprinopsis marcescibilis]
MSSESLPRLTDLQSCHNFVLQASASEVARQLLRDKEACTQEGVPSLLVHALPHKGAADAIALAMNKDDRIPLPIARMLYSTLVTSVKEYLANMETPRSSIPEHMVPSDQEFEAALKVLRYLQLPHVSAIKSPSTPLDKVINIIHSHLLHGTGFMEAQVKPRRDKLCYICRYTVRYPHRLYASLCNPCGEFNVSSSAMSLPQNLNLSGKTAFVSGGRVNLGYHTALRLLRCGANVIVSSRYPYDAEHRYLSEGDAGSWNDRLKIVGADFRSAKDVFSLINAVKRCCQEWKVKRADTIDPDTPVLNILINNAAQTLTDSVGQEAEGIQKEETFANSTTGRLVLDDSYQPRIRGGHRAYLIESSSKTTRLIEGAVEETIPDPQPTPSTAPAETNGGQGTLIIPTVKSSWTQTISEIPYEDVISAHSVNTFVPFILLRELLPIMVNPNRKRDASTGLAGSVPVGYVINVSSREGLFEKRPNSTAKNGLHVHTNMSKAALNMLTETEAASSWKTYKIAINSVDPGYMSADPMFMEQLGRAGQPCPIGWEDGAGRVLWPVAKGEKGDVVWGRFLKHFQDTAVGR